MEVLDCSMAAEVLAEQWPMMSHTTAAVEERHKRIDTVEERRWRSPMRRKS